MENRKIRILLLITILLITLLMAGCKSEVDQPVAETLQEYTINDLAKFNGKDGNPAYVAVEDMVYDVTELSGWKNGEHNGFQAGQDLTDPIKNQSPHGVSMLKRAKIVGKLID